MIWDGILPLDFHLASLHFPPPFWCFPLRLLSSLLFCFILSCFICYFWCLTSVFFIYFTFYVFHGGLHLNPELSPPFISLLMTHKKLSPIHTSLPDSKPVFTVAQQRASPDWLKGMSQTWCVKYSIYLSTHTLYQLGLSLQGSFSFSLQNIQISLLN